MKNRLDSNSGISFTEFSYQLLQAHDFAHLYKHHGCRVQLGGSDQWGNIVAGVDLIKKQRAADIRRELGAHPDRAWVQPGKSEDPLMTRRTVPHGIERWRHDEKETAQKFGANQAAEMERKFGREADQLAWGLTIPLLLNRAGEKFGKSAGNAIWMDENLTSASDLYQVSQGGRSPTIFGIPCVQGRD